MDNIKMTEFKKSKIGDLYDKRKIQGLVDEYNRQCTIKGKFPLMLNGFFLTFFTIYFGFAISLIALKLTISLYSEESVISWMIAILLVSMLASLFIYIAIAENVKRFFYIRWLKSRGIIGTMKIFLKFKKNKKDDLEKEYLQIQKEKFRNNFLCKFDINELIMKTSEIEIKIQKMNYNTLLAFVVTILTYIKVDTKLEITYNLLNDFSTIFYYLIIIIAPCVLLYAFIYFIPLIHSKLTQDPYTFKKKQHYFNFLTFLEDSLEKENNHN